MLRKPNDKVRFCYQRAAQARERAALETHAGRKAYWLKLEDNWIALAQSCQLEESLSDFTGEVRRFLKRSKSRDRQRKGKRR